MSQDVTFEVRAIRYCLPGNMNQGFWMRGLARHKWPPVRDRTDLGRRELGPNIAIGKSEAQTRGSAHTGEMTDEGALRMDSGCCALGHIALHLAAS
jgi:hypothetical protein